MATDRISPDKPVNNGGGGVSTPSGPQPIGVVYEEHLSDKLEISDGIGVQSNDEPPVAVPPGDGLDAPAYAIRNLQSIPRAGKWRGHAFAGMVVPRSALVHPDTDLVRWLNFGAIGPATLGELADYERHYGEPREVIERRAREIDELRRALRARVARARKDSERTTLLVEFIREWSAIESQCRERWAGEFGGLIGKTEEQVRRHYLDRESDLRTCGGKEDAYREEMKAVAEPLLIAAAGIPNTDTTLLHDFLQSTAQQFNGRNPVEWNVLQWLPQLRYKLLHIEAADDADGIGEKEDMAKRNKTPETNAPEIKPNVGITLLQEQIEKGERLLAQKPVSSNAYDAWELVTKNVLEKAFGKGSPNVESIMDVGKFGFTTLGNPPSYYDEQRAGDLTTQLSKMRGLTELLQTEIKLQTVGSAVSVEPPPRSHRIFLVHGHDEHALEATSRFLERLDQEVVILREQPSKGQTIIEKFEACADVGFAIVLLTPDDRGGTSNAPSAQQKPRARQNVVFELGYFIGRLGRNRVCAIHRTGVELPSDYSGVVYQEFDERGAWKMELAKELRAAGFDIDMNKAC